MILAAVNLTMDTADLNGQYGHVVLDKSMRISDANSDSEAKGARVSSAFEDAHVVS